MAVRGATLVELFAARVGETPDAVAMRYRSGEAWQPVTYRRWDDLARAAGNGLASLGLVPGERVGLLSRNRMEWHVCDLAVLLAGGVTVPVYATKSASQVAGLLAHSHACMVIVEDRDQLAKVLQGRSGSPALRAVVVLDGAGVTEGEGVITFEALCRRGRSHAAEHPGLLEGRAAALGEQDVASIVYTSGTTGAPKGALLTHRNFIATLTAGIERAGLGDGERLISYLSYAHIFERLITEWATVSFGAEVWFARSMATIAEDLRDCRPTFFIGVPRVFEKFVQGINEQVAQRPPLTRRLVARAVAAGSRIVAAQQAGRTVPAGLRAAHWLYGAVVTARIRRGLGMHACRLAISGAAPLSPDVLMFINAIGIRLVEGYGMTETTAPACVNLPDHPRLGTVGPPLRGMEVRTAEDGEILVRGPGVFPGYLDDDEASAQALDPDGFLHTGDIGSIDAAGYLTITDRKKDLIITAGGKNIAPQAIEAALMHDPLISQAVVVGDRRPYVTALLTLDAASASRWAGGHGLADVAPGELAGTPAVREQISAAVEAVNRDLSRVEQVKRWTVLPHDFSEAAEELTTTAKVRRHVVLARYAAEIEAMYARPAA